MSSDLPGSVEETSPPTLRSGVDRRRNVSVVPHGGAVSHPSTGQNGVMPPLPTAGKPGQFSMKGELMHVFVSYRVNTEGPEGSGLAGRIADKIRSLSMDPRLELQIPRQGWGFWPMFAKKPVPFREEEAKCFLDKDCLQDGQSWSTPKTTRKRKPQTLTPKPQTPSAGWRGLCRGWRCRWCVSRS